MNKKLVPLLALLALGGCAYQTEAQINARMAAHIGQSETDLVRDMGVPNRTYASGGHHFLAYMTGHQEIESFNDGGFGYPGWGWGWGGWGYGGGGWGGGWGGWGGGFGSATVTNYGCQTTFEVDAGRVIGFKRHGNAC
jgi:hypothetical protein